MSRPSGPGQALLAAIAERDYERIAGCFAENASFRALTPGPVREHAGPEEAAQGFRRWLAALESFEVLEGEVDEIADRLRIRYRFRGRDPEKGWRLNEHTGYAAVERGRIQTMILTCTGFRPTAPP